MMGISGAISGVEYSEGSWSGEGSPCGVTGYLAACNEVIFKGWMVLAPYTPL